MSATETSSKENTSNNGWRIDDPDEANYNFSDEKGLWQPKSEDILSMFEKLAKGGPLSLKWTCPGRRPPSKDVKLDDSIEERMDADGEDSKEAESKVQETSAFDFDEPQVDINAKLTPRRAPGGVGRTPRTVKRVARMDNIMKSLKKQQQSEREARRIKGSPSSGMAGGKARLFSGGAPSPKIGSAGSVLPSMSLGTEVSTVSQSVTTSATTPLPSIISSKIASPGPPKVTSETLSTSNGTLLPHGTVHSSKASDASGIHPHSNVGTPSKTAVSVHTSSDSNKVSDPSNITKGMPESSTVPPAQVSTAGQSAGDFPKTEVTSDLPRSAPSSAGLSPVLGTVISSMTNNLITTQTIPNPIPTIENVSLDEEFGLKENTLPSTLVSDQPTTLKLPTGAGNVTTTASQSTTGTATSTASSVLPTQISTAATVESNEGDNKAKPTSSACDTSHEDQLPAVSKAVTVTNHSPPPNDSSAQISPKEAVSVSESVVANTDEQGK